MLIFVQRIRGLKQVDDVEVVYGTNETMAIDLLAQETTIIDNFDNTHIVGLSWEIIDFQSLVIGDFDAIGTFELPEGVQQSDPPTPLLVNGIVSVLEPGLINEIDLYNEVTDIEVPLGTPEPEARNTFQQEITVTDTHGFEFIVILDWGIEGYDSETEGTYNASGSFTLPFGVDQTNPATDLIVYANVTVLGPLYSLTLNANPPESATLNGDGEYYEGDEINISATPNENWEFIDWTFADNTIASTEIDFTYTMPDESVQLTANFRLKTSIDVLCIEHTNVYYNPGIRSVIIESDYKIDNLQLYCINGRTVLRDQINNTRANINVGKVNPGVYVVRLSSQGTMITRKITIN